MKKTIEDYGVMKSVFLGYENKRLGCYKEELLDVKKCMICGKPLDIKGGKDQYGELGSIHSGREWWYNFVVVCDDCFSKVQKLLGGIKKDNHID